MSRSFVPLVPLIICGAMASAVWSDEPSSGQPAFNRDIRPILADKCFHCHGPDSQVRQADLRLDLAEDAHASGVLDHTSSAPSELARRITADDASERMPPPEADRKLTSEEISLLKRWVREGAQYEPHWAFLPPTEGDIPSAEKSVRPAVNPIDRFVSAALRDRDLLPQPKATRESLIRRVTFDLTGLPPTVAEVDAFLRDTQPGAYGRVVDRLLNSPRFGERFAQDWLDLARYADSHGYQGDEYSSQWPWREWVIGALNANLPFDKFVTWQLAGDLLPGATQEQILATGFNRNHAQNVEGGIVAEEYRVEYVADRAQTFGTALLGLTVGCARCHDHKYDPISQREFYELFSFFNNVPESGQITYHQRDMPGPTILLADPAQRAELCELENRIAERQRALDEHMISRQADFEHWLASRGDVRRGLAEHRPPAEPLAHFPLENPSNERLTNSIDAARNGRIVDPVGDKIANVAPTPTRGVVGSGLQLTGDDALVFPDVGKFSRGNDFSVGLWVRIPEKLAEGVIFHSNRGAILYTFKGYQVSVEQGKFDVRLAHDFPANSLHLLSRDDVPRDRWLHLVLTYDGSSRADGVRLYVDGEAIELSVQRDRLYKDIVFHFTDARSRKKPLATYLRVGARWRSRGLSGGSVDEIFVYGRELSSLEVARWAGHPRAERLLTEPPDRLTAAERGELSDYFFARHDADRTALLAELEQLRLKQARMVEPWVESMVMEELSPPRQANVLERGAYDAPTEAVEPNTPRAVLPYPADLPPNRLGLAEWLFHPRNPLTARVAVNRYWQILFGRGLVITPEDFGTQGTLPTHPELLDWLAIWFREADWDVKRLARLLVTSRTYCQASAADQIAPANDPSNRWLTRGPGGRLTAEQVRDNALAVSGLLVERLGGPSVKPYQPEGVWSINPTSGAYVQDRGAGLYRRSLYTYWKRTIPPPSMNTFDAPSRAFCTVRREETTSPMQALLLLNDPQFVEAARVMAENLVRAYRHDLDARFVRGFRDATSRTPTSREMAVLRALYEDQHRYFSAEPRRAHEVVRVGQHPVDAQLPEVDVAATTMVASALLNLDSGVAKP